MTTNNTKRHQTIRKPNQLGSNLTSIDITANQSKPNHTRTTPKKTSIRTKKCKNHTKQHQKTPKPQQKQTKPELSDLNNITPNHSETNHTQITPKNIDYHLKYTNHTK